MTETRKHRSVSQLNSYERCPHAYFLAREMRVWQRPAAWLAQGSAVHEVGESWEKSGRTMTLEECQDLFRESYARHINEACEKTPNLDWWFASGPYKGEADIERRYNIGLEQVEKFINWHLEHADQVIWIAPDGTPGIELQFDIELDGVLVRGFIDAVREVEGEVRVVDYKGLALDTEIPTPTGWTTMGDVRVGDEVFTWDGSVCRVIAKSGVKRIGTYVVRFDDGSEITCDTEHIWWTQRANETVSAKGMKEIIETLRSNRGQAHHRVIVAGALHLPEQSLTLNPYVLGCWLGDGKHSSGEITKDRDLFNLIELEGFELGKAYNDPRSPGTITHTVLGIRSALIELNLLGNKHMPAKYLRGSYSQRLALLQGLMDTDGCWNIARKSGVFSTTDRGLAEGITELLRTLGQRPCLKPIVAKGYGKVIDAFHVEFTPVDLIPFRHPRKLAAMKSTGEKSPTRSSRRVIVSIEPGPDVETACIGVDSPNNTYLCGRQMIPTHNTGNSPGDDFQLGVYGVALAEMFDIEPPKLGEYFMARTAKPTFPYPIDDWTRERVSERFRELDENIKAERFDPKPDPKTCNFCDVQLSCVYRAD